MSINEQLDWDLYGPVATFLAGAAFTVIAFGLLVLQKQFLSDLRPDLTKVG